MGKRNSWMKAAFSGLAACGALIAGAEAATPVSLPACAPGSSVSVDLSTGTTLSGGPLARDMLDPKWEIVVAPPGAALPAAAPTYKVKRSIFWAKSAFPSDWIAPWRGKPKNQIRAVSGTYRYTLTFNIPALPSTYASLALSGTCSGDDSATIRINANPPIACGALWTPGAPFNANVGAYFVVGANTLSVDVQQVKDFTGMAVSAKLHATC